MSTRRVSCGERVRIHCTPETEEAGLAGLMGTVCGHTAASVAGVPVIGDARGDEAINVHVGGRGFDWWLAPETLELVGHQDTPVDPEVLPPAGPVAPGGADTAPDGTVLRALQPVARAVVVVEQQHVVAPLEFEDGARRDGVLQGLAVVAVAQWLGLAPGLTLVRRDRAPDVASIGTHDHHQPPVRQSDGVRLLGVAGAALGLMRYRDRIIEAEPRDPEILRHKVLRQVLYPEELDLAVAGNAAGIVGMGCPARESDQGPALAVPMRNRG
jgi:hypothetical protein